MYKCSNGVEVGMSDAVLAEPTALVEPLDFVRPYRPNAVDPKEHQLSRLLVGGRSRQSVFGQEQFDFSAIPLTQTPLVSARTFRVTFSHCEFYLQLGMDALEFAMEKLNIQDPIDHLAGALRDAVLIALVESFCGQVFGAIPLRLQSVKPDALSQVERFSLELARDNERSVNARVLVHKEFLPVVIQWLMKEQPQGRAPSPSIAALPLPVGIVLDEFYVAQALLETLQVGDVVITDAQGNEVTVRVSNRMQQKGQLMDESITLDGYLEEFEREMRPDGELVVQDSNQNYQQAKDLFQDIPMQLSFELHQTTLKLEQLRGLNEGQCLPLPGASTDSVTVRVNGKPFAQGEIVRIQDQIGVRITKVFGAS